MLKALPYSFNAITEFDEKCPQDKKWSSFETYKAYAYIYAKFALVANRIFFRKDSSHRCQSFAKAIPSNIAPMNCKCTLTAICIRTWLNSQYNKNAIPEMAENTKR